MSVEVCVLDWSITPFRADRWLDLWEPAVARMRSSEESGRARYGRSSATGNRIGPSFPSFFSTSTWSVTVPDTSHVCPAISPSP